jgi:hypothetical protein
MDSTAGSGAEASKSSAGGSEGEDAVEEGSIESEEEDGVEEEEGSTVVSSAIDGGGMTDAESSVASGALENCMEGLVVILEADVFGSTAQQRAADSGYKSNMIEARSCKSYDSFQLLAAALPFLPSPCLRTLLDPALQRLAESDDSSVVRVAQVR